jgi:uncharacterized protein (TIGR03086 family)
VPAATVPGMTHTAPAAPVDQLAHALDTTGSLVAELRAEELALPTPCSGWTVRDLLAHLVGGQFLFAQLLRGEEPAPGADPLGADPSAAYAGSARALLDAFRSPGALERAVTVPIGTVPGVVALHLRLVEALVHGWDLARATGRPLHHPAALVEQALTFTRNALGEVPAGRAFAPPQPVPDDAPAIDRLAALLGRSVAPA